MRISDILADKRGFSFENVPPKGELSVQEVDSLYVYCMNTPEVVAAAHDALMECGYSPA